MLRERGIAASYLQRAMAESAQRTQSAQPTVEVLWWEGCPSTPATLADVRAAVAEAGLDPARVDVREVRTDEDAVREDFRGSPTVRVDGEDVAAPPAGEPIALACRVYRLRDGRVSPTPDPADVRRALAAALERRRTG